MVLVVSGDHLTATYDEPDAMRRWLIDHGVPAERIVSDNAGEDTYSSCVRAREVFGVTSSILISQSYHLPRAITTCRLVGIDAVGVGDDTARHPYPLRWAKYALREVPADIKMLIDVLTHRQPILGPPDPSVANALNP